MKATPELKIAIDHLYDGPLDIELDLAPEEMELTDEQYTFDSPVQGRFVLNMVGQDIEAHGKISTSAVASCVRCLGPVRLPLAADIHELWMKRTAQNARELQDDDDADVEYYEGEELHYGDTLRELIMLELLAYPRCSSDCKGLCPSCGANLNHESCPCNRDDADAGGAGDWKAQLRSLKPQ